MPQPQFTHFVADDQQPQQFSHFVPDTEAPGASTPTATMSATSNHPSWIDQAEEDLREGGGRTIMGRALGHLQGRGDKGFTGLGEGPMGADALPASPIMGAVHAAQGVRHGSPMQALAGVGEAAQIPLAFMAGPEAKAGAEAIPSRAFAAKTLNAIGNEAAGVPVRMSQTEPALANFEGHVARGAKNADVMSKLRGRFEAPEQGPIHFPEAREFYTNVSDATRRPGFFKRMLEDSQEPRMRRNAGEVRDALHSDLRSAADQVGRGEDYQNAIDEYAKAARNVRMGKRAALTGAGMALGGTPGYKAYKFAKGVFGQ